MNNHAAPKSSQNHLDTIAIHAGRDDFRTLGVHAPPLDLSTTYPVGDISGAAAQLDEFASGNIPEGSPIYARLHNPTVGRFENAMAKLEGSDAAVGFASGMGALTAIFMALPLEKRHVVAIRPIYGGTDHLISSDLLGIETTWVSADSVADAIRANTGLVILETPQNPTTTLVDIAAVAKQCGDVPLLVDNTFATPALQRPIEHGASIVVHSATKYLGGHGDAMGGIVCCNTKLAGQLRGVRIATGAVLHPFAAYQLHRGLSTLGIRMRAMQETATELARRLKAHDAIAYVHHPSLPDTDKEGLVGRQMSGPGSMLSFELVGGYEAARTLLNNVNLMTHAVSLGSTDSLIQHPASLTHRLVSEEDREGCGVSDSLVRMSVGLEHVDDLWDDLAAAITATPEEAITPPDAIVI